MKGFIGFTAYMIAAILRLAAIMYGFNDVRFSIAGRMCNQIFCDFNQSSIKLFTISGRSSWGQCPVFGMEWNVTS